MSESIQCYQCGTRMTLAELVKNQDDCPECGAQHSLNDVAKALDLNTRATHPALNDPEAVLANMMRGTIARPSVRSFSKLFGDVVNGEDAQLLEIARLREELAATHPAPASVGGEKMRERFSQIENEIMAGKHTASSVFTQMRTAALYMATTVPAGSRVVPVELLERITRKFSPQWDSLNQGQAIRELRALLDVKS